MKKIKLLTPLLAVSAIPLVATSCTVTFDPSEPSGGVKYLTEKKAIEMGGGSVSGLASESFTAKNDDTFEFSFKWSDVIEKAADCKDEPSGWTFWLGNIRHVSMDASIDMTFVPFDQNTIEIRVDDLEPKEFGIDFECTNYYIQPKVSWNLTQDSVIHGSAKVQQIARLNGGDITILPSAELYFLVLKSFG